MCMRMISGYSQDLSREVDSSVAERQQDYWAPFAFTPRPVYANQR